MPESDEKKFNETLKRMLKTPPTPHAEGAKSKKGKATPKKKKPARGGLQG
ncbi:hypothetical protein [Mesorhizobium sp. ZC-5]|nr:hypothetical protein [Mesorhizobium sp. ZC-5]MCV3243764.1 hypothetical protein [Mesorhizobium sp. ZC-5]